MGARARSARVGLARAAGGAGAHRDAEDLRPAVASSEGPPPRGASRRGKWLLFPTVDGALQLRIHLMSAGRTRHLAAGAKGPKTPAFRLRFENGGELVLTEAGSKKRAGVWPSHRRRPRWSSRISAPRRSGSGPEGCARSSPATTADCIRCCGSACPRRHRPRPRERDPAPGAPVAVRAFEKTRREEIERLAAAIDDLARALELRLAGKGDKDVYLVHRRLASRACCGDPLRQVDYEEHTVFYCAPCQTGGRS